MEIFEDEATSSKIKPLLRHVQGCKKESESVNIMKKANLCDRSNVLDLCQSVKNQILPASEILQDFLDSGT